MDGYYQIKKYISEGKFHGIFSNVQMFVVSNVVDTKYFSAARDTELRKKFISGWLDEKNNPVCNYIEFADSVLHIPQAHKMVAQYTVLDKESKKLLLLRPYQIHAIEAMRKASQQGESGYIWHTTGSGKTMTSYKAAHCLIWLRLIRFSYIALPVMTFLIPASASASISLGPATPPLTVNSTSGNASCNC